MGWVNTAKAAIQNSNNVKGGTYPDNTSTYQDYTKPKNPVGPKEDK